MKVSRTNESLRDERLGLRKSFISRKADLENQDCLERNDHLKRQFQYETAHL